MYQTAKRGFLTARDYSTQVFEDRKPDQIFVLYPIVFSETGNFERYEAAFECDGIPYVGTLRDDMTIQDGFDRVSARDAMRSARERAGWGKS